MPGKRGRSANARANASNAAEVRKWSSQHWPALAEKRGGLFFRGQIAEKEALANVFVADRLGPVAVMLVVARRKAEGRRLDVEPLATRPLPAHKEMLAGVDKMKRIAQSPTYRDIQDRHRGARAAAPVEQTVEEEGAGIEGEVKPLTA